MCAVRSFLRTLAPVAHLIRLGRRNTSLHMPTLSSRARPFWGRRGICFCWSRPSPSRSGDGRHPEPRAGRSWSSSLLIGTAGPQPKALSSIDRVPCFAFEWIFQLSTLNFQPLLKSPALHHRQPRILRKRRIARRPLAQNKYRAALRLNSPRMHAIPAQPRSLALWLSHSFCLPSETSAQVARHA